MVRADVLAGNQGEEWLSVSDLMAGLMMLFMAIAIFFMVQVQDIAVAYNDLQEELYNDLRGEFEEDLARWNAELDRESMSIRFTEPDVLFDPGQATLKSEFEDILRDFFPRYVALLTSDKYKSHVEELRIEGHTSSEWTDETGPDEAYFNNMRLSQERTRAVLQFVYLLDESGASRDWLKKALTANGLSSSQPIMVDGEEDRPRSRRVEFRVRTDAEEQMRSLYEGLRGLADR